MKIGRRLVAFNSLSEWAKAYGDTLDSRDGHVRVISSGYPTAVRMNPDGQLNTTFKNNTSLKLRVHVENAANLETLVLYFATDTSYANFVTYEIGVGIMWDQFAAEGYNEFHFDLKNPTLVNGTVDLSNAVFSTVQLYVQSATGTTAKVTFYDLIKDESNRAKAILTFDDGWSSVYTEGFRYMSGRSIVGNVAVVSSFVNASGYMTKGQLDELYGYGWGMLNHTATHQNLSTLTPIQIENEIDTCENYLATNGLSGSEDIVVYPYGGYNQDVLDYVNTKRAGRGLIVGFESQPVVQKSLIKTFNCVPGVTPAMIANRIDQAIVNGTAIHLLWHRLETPVIYDTQYAPSDFRAIIDYLDSKRDLIDAVTFSEFLDGCEV